MLGNTFPCPLDAINAVCLTTSVMHAEITNYATTADKNTNWTQTVTTNELDPHFA